MKTTFFQNDESDLIEINNELQKLLGEEEAQDFIKGVHQGLEVLDKLGIDPRKQDV